MILQRIPFALICTIGLQVLYLTPSYCEETEDAGLGASLGLELQYDDNIFQSASSPISSVIGILTPSLSLNATPGNHRLSLTYDGEYGWFDDSPGDDYENHLFEAGAYLAREGRVRVEVVGNFDSVYERRGRGLTEGFESGVDRPDDPDQYEQIRGLVRVALGATTSPRRLSVEGGIRELEYQNNIARTQFFNLDETFGNATGYFDIGANTSLLLEVRYLDVAYPVDRQFEPTLDNEEYRYLAGVTWEVTGRTKGTIKAGYVNKEFDSSARGDFSDPTWEVGIRWSPRSYSHFDLIASRAPTSTNALGSFIDSTNFGITWEHGWNNRLKTELSGRYLDESYEGSPGEREQQTTQISLFFKYEMWRWLEWKIGAKINERSSNLDRFDFDDSIYSIGLLLSI